jgi:hypothetical protein
MKAIPLIANHPSSAKPVYHRKIPAGRFGIRRFPDFEAGLSLNPPETNGNRRSRCFVFYTASLVLQKAEI